MPLVTAFLSEIQSWDATALPPVDYTLFIDELYRLEANLIEMGDQAFQGDLRLLYAQLNRLTGLDENGKKVATSLFDRLFELPEETAEQLGEYQRLLLEPKRDILIGMGSRLDLSIDTIPVSMRSVLISEAGDGIFCRDRIHGRTRRGRSLPGR